jgi:hypothetical protein
MTMSRRKILLGVAAAVVLPPASYFALHRPFPSDQTPEGAYVRVAFSVSRSDPRGFFAYLEQEAQWACYTLHDVRKKARDRVLASYPERAVRGCARRQRRLRSPVSNTRLGAPTAERHVGHRVGRHR